MPTDKRCGCNHFFRPGSRASFLYPSWLSTPPVQWQLRHRFKRYLLKMRQSLMAWFIAKGPILQAEQAYLEILIEELQLRELSQGTQSWQKNSLHQARQNQLFHFGKILDVHDALKDNAVHATTFPEIILVMAQAIQESQVSSTKLFSSARDLIKSYNKLRSHLCDIHKQELFPRLHITTSSPFLALLLDFRELWQAFYCHRTLQLRQSDPEKPLINLSQTLGSIPLEGSH